MGALTVILAGQVTTQEPTPQFEPLTVTSSIQAPAALTLLSVARRHLITTFCPFAAAGKLTVVVINPPELPLQACRPAIGLPKARSIVELYPPVTNEPPAVRISANGPPPIDIS